MAVGQWFRVVSRWIYFHPSQEAKKPKFVHLGPTADADQTGAYFEALDFATQQKEVLNIALTGPYGSGKSSVIKSFLRKYKGHALQISLAAFVANEDKATGQVNGTADGENSKAETQDIERSVLQQILYRVQADKLPFSRFKRIRPPKAYGFVISAFVVLGAAAAWYIASKSADVLSGAFFRPYDLTNWQNYLILVVGVIFFWRVVHAVYSTSFGLSLKSISLKDLQIAPDTANEASILNKHLDEILYFFQSTNYDLVVIEDLDRFENTDIFVTLREINALLNGNEGIERPIRFLYALRDDIFLNTDRTKFFEFIVPVIPIISHSNSIDKVLEQSKRADLVDRLDKRFIQDVSRHLTDMRLIHNIFNEYAVYSANIQPGSEGALDPNKLLAVLIYKNVIPTEFAALHEQKGVLSTILRQYDEYVGKIETELKAEISEIETELASGDAQLLRDQSELRKVYAMTILETIPKQYHTLKLPSGSGNIPLAKMVDSEEFDAIISARSIWIGGDPYRVETVQHSILSVEKSVDPERSFADRKAALERKSQEFRQDSQQRIRERKRELGSIRTRKFNEVVRESPELTEALFSEVGENQELLKFLILEGHLDDTYYQYISLFHSGRLSPNDNRFLVLIRAYTNPPPDFPLDNVAEVVREMRREDFGHDYVLNRFIFDHLLADAAAHSSRIATAVDFIAGNFDRSSDFFKSYYERGARVPTLIDTLATKWGEFPTVALRNINSTCHAARILAYLPDHLLKKEPYAGGIVATYISERTRETLDEGVDFEPARLKTLGVRVADLLSIVEYAKVHAFVEHAGLYRISIANLRHIVSRATDPQALQDLDRRHYSTLLKVNNEELLRRLNDDFEDYVSEVLLELDENSAEDTAAIISIIARDDVDPELLDEFLSRQQVVFPTFDGVPVSFHSGLMERLKIEPTWENCASFLASEFYSPEVLIGFLNSSIAKAALSSQPVPGEAGAPLQVFLIENDDLELDVYRAYVKRLPSAFAEFPDVDVSRIRVLIEQHVVDFTAESFESLEEIELGVLFLAENFDAYSQIKSDITIDDEYRSKLLRTGIGDADKLTVIEEMDPAYVVANPLAAADIGSILNRVTLESIPFGAAFIEAVIISSQPIDVQISLLNKLHGALNKTAVLSVLERLPSPFREIASPGKTPKLENNEINATLASWLDAENIISSVSPAFFGSEIRINTYKKKI